MQHNLKRGLSLTLSLMLLLGTVSACNRDANQPQTTLREAPARPAVIDEAQDSEADHQQAPPSANDKQIALKRSAVPATNRPQIDVPPPPLGIVPVSSVRRSGKPDPAKDDDDAFNPPSPTTVRTAHRTEGRGTASSQHNQTERVPTASRTSPNRSKVSYSPTRSLTPIEQASVADRRQKVREQELLAQKLVRERAAQQAQLRQARLTARRWGNARGFGVRGATQMAEKQPKQAAPGWPVLVGNSK